MSLLTMVQEVVGKVLKEPLPSSITTAVGSADANVQQIIQLLNEEGRQCSSRHPWQALRGEASFTTAGVAGGILNLTGLVGGAGYAGGFSSVYGIVPLTGGFGTGATATIGVTNGSVTSVVLLNTGQGSGYHAGDVLSASNANLGGSGAGFSITVATVGIVGVQDQGSILTITGPDFNFVVNETFWDRTTRRPVFGPKTPAEWQQLQAQQMQGPWYQFTLRGNRILFLPPPPPGDLCFLEWITKYWCASSAGTPQPKMVADSDVSRLDEDLHVLGGIWRYKQANRLAYQKDEDKYERMFADLTSRDGIKARLNLAGAQNDLYPGVLVPSGNWPISGNP